MHHSYDGHMATTRITVTVDDDVLDAARAASGGEGSLSKWVAEAMADKAEKERRLAAMGEALAAYQAEYGTFTEEELQAQRDADEANAIHVRDGKIIKPGSGAA